MTRELNEQETLDAMRQAILAAMDSAAATIFAGSALIGRDPGATDSDLPGLFDAIDRHTRTLAARYGFTFKGDDSAGPRFAVDGHEYEDSDSPLDGDGMFAPFYIFDIPAQSYLPVTFSDRSDALSLVQILNAKADARA